MKKFIHILPVFAVMAILLTAGCGHHKKKPEGMPKLYPVSVLITQSNQPLEGATVTFIGQTPELKKWSAGGITNAEGIVVPWTLEFEGIAEGEYSVTVVKTDKVTEEEVKKNGPPDPDRLKYKTHFVSSEYRTADKTPLRITVQKGSNEQFTLDVGEPVSEKLGPGMKPVQ